MQHKWHQHGKINKNTETYIPIYIHHTHNISIVANNFMRQCAIYVGTLQRKLYCETMVIAYFFEVIHAYRY